VGKRWTSVLGGLLVLPALVPVAAAELRLLLHSAGAPVANAVVELTPQQGVVKATPRDAVMDQVNTEFVPRVLVVTAGSRVSFPNSDTTRHQVYSFSPAKRFELPLYSGTPPEPVVFDTAGVVTLGCNIHDAMVGYIVVVASPYHGLSGADGVVALDVPEGDYTARVWHERLTAGLFEQAVSLPLPASPLRIELALAPPPPPRGDDRLRALQERFRNQKREPD
jgi:plastocyanin